VELPAQVGRFLVQGVLGRGGFGVVYRATDPQLEREVAVKVPQPGLVGSVGDRERFLREAKAAARLNHPYIVPVYDAGEENGRYYIASAFVDGNPLADQIDGLRDEFTRIAQITRKLAEALQYAHEQGIVHRDVKPQNVLIDSAGNPRLLDFGLAKIEGSAHKLTQEAVVMGTPAYMSPEQARGESSAIGPASDQYSLGALLYELLSGRTPFSGSPQIVIFNVLNEVPEPPRKANARIPRPLETICLKAMSKDPGQRYDSLGDMADDLDRWLSDRPIQARRAHVVERFVRWCRRNPIVASLVVLVFAVTAAGFAATSAALLRAEKDRLAATEAAKDADRARQKAEERKKEVQAALDQVKRQEQEALRAKDFAEEQTTLAEERLAAVTKAQEETELAKKAEALARDAQTSLNKNLTQTQSDARKDAYWNAMVAAYSDLTPKNLATIQTLLKKHPPDPAYGNCWEWYQLNNVTQSKRTLSSTVNRHPQLLREVGTRASAAISDVDHTIVVAGIKGTHLQLVRIGINRFHDSNFTPLRPPMALSGPASEDSHGVVVNRTGAYLWLRAWLPDKLGVRQPKDLAVDLQSNTAATPLRVFLGPRVLSEEVLPKIRDLIGDDGAFYGSQKAGQHRNDGALYVDRPFSQSTAPLVEATDPPTQGVFARSSDGLRHVRFADADNVGVVWSNLQSQTFHLSGHKARVTHAEFFPDASRLVTASDDGTIRLWRTDQSEQPIVLMRAPSHFSSIDISDDGRCVVCMSDSGGLALFDGRNK